MNDPLNTVYVLVSINDDSPVMNDASDDDVAYEAIVMDHLRQVFDREGFGITVHQVESVDWQDGHIARKLAEVGIAPN